MLDPADGGLTEERFKASRDQLVAWIETYDGELDVVAIEATTGWRWVARVQARGTEVQLTDPGQASALQATASGPRPTGSMRAGLVTLLAREPLPEARPAPEDIQRLRDQTRLRTTLTDDHTRRTQRLHSSLVHEG